MNMMYAVLKLSLRVQLCSEKGGLCSGVEVKRAKRV